MIEKLKEIMIGIMPDIEFMEIGEDTTLKDDLGLDSLSLVMMSVEIEDEFGFRFDEFRSFETVGDVCEYIREKNSDQRRPL